MPQPSVEQQLRTRATRILTDGRHHETAALAWAALLVLGRLEQQPETLSTMQQHGFTARELSLGATKW